MLKKAFSKRNLIIFFGTAILFFLVTWFTNTVLSAYDVTSVRISATFNPIFGIAFGWPAILGCAVGNFVCDLVCGWGLSVAHLGFPEQIIYGFIPFFLWRRYIGCESHYTRLDSPKKTMLFTGIIALDSVFIGLSVGYIQFTVSGDDFWTTAYFAGFCDFCMCMIFGLPLMTGIDFFYSRFMHTKKRRLSINEIVILYSSCIQLLLTFAVAGAMLISRIGGSFESVWADIFTVSGYVVSFIIVASIIVMYYCASHKKKTATLRIFDKEKGTIFVDEKRRLEFISFPSMDLQYRVKADSLGYTYEDARKKVRPSYENAWYTMLSNQKGCPMKCSFCDCPGYGFYGNVSMEDLRYQISTIIENTGSTHTKWFEVDFMRMGEPSFNEEILKYIEFELCDQIRSKVDAEVIYPTLSTMMPRAVKNLGEYIRNYCRIKNDVYDGNAALQFSINTTDEDVRRKTFRNMSLTIPEIAEIGKTLPYPKGRKYALNFAVTKDTVIDATYIDSLFDKDKFLIKLTPIHQTFNAVDNGFNITTEYSEFNVFERFETSFINLGWEVMTFLDRAEEDQDSLTCGNLLLSNIQEKFVPQATEKKRIGLLVAIEIDAIFKKYPNWKEIDSPEGFKMFIVEKDKYDMYICQCGMGISAASSGVQLLATKYNVSLIINYGVVGGLTKTMSAQKVCIVDKIVHYKYDCSEFMDLEVGQVDGHDSIYLRTSPNLLKNVKMVNNDITVATCCSGDKFVGTVEEKTYLHEKFGGDICDMEAAGVALTCEANNLPLVMFKAVADGLSDGAEGFYTELQNASMACLDVTDKILEKIVMMEY